ncbi:MAG TPA: hypothetical protein VN175_10560 [Rhizomicrobium sp.]|nr:hypothetical protein [Rhizomicrobium sp.]
MELIGFFALIWARPRICGSKGQARWLFLKSSMSRAASGAYAAATAWSKGASAIAAPRSALAAINIQARV